MQYLAYHLEQLNSLRERTVLIRMSRNKDSVNKNEQKQRTIKSDRASGTLDTGMN